jgi:hypothetical protein
MRPMYAFPHIICVAICTRTDASQVEFDPGCKAMIYTVDGTPLHGISVLRTKDWDERKKVHAPSLPRPPAMECLASRGTARIFNHPMFVSSLQLHMEILTQSVARQVLPTHFS